jgi:hypothetical protein
MNILFAHPLSQFEIRKQMLKVRIITERRKLKPSDKTYFSKTTEITVEPDSRCLFYFDKS